MRSCIIVDDQESAIKVIEDHIKKSPELRLIKTFTNALEAFEFLKVNTIDLVFLDVQLPHLNGIKFIEALKTENGSIPTFILTTGYSKYALSGFDQGVHDFLLKPIFFKRFRTSIERLIENWKKNGQFISPNVEKNYFFIESKGARLKINYENIVYVESTGNYITIVENKAERLIYNKPMHLLQELLPEPKFIRVHNSFIVAMNFVYSAKINEIVLKVEGKNDIKIPVGGKFKDNVLKHFPSN